MMMMANITSVTTGPRTICVAMMIMMMMMLIDYGKTMIVLKVT